MSEEIKKEPTIFYGLINDHYGFDTSSNRMSTYVEIPRSEHHKLIESGMDIKPDENGYPINVPYPGPTQEELNQIEIDELENYLKTTDWYASRYAETGKEIPETIKAKRREARERISELRATIE